MFWYQNTACFHLVFHWVSKLVHLTKIDINYWLLMSWIINKFEKCSATILRGYFQVTANPASVVEAWLLEETSYNDEKMLPIVHEGWGVFIVHPTCIGWPLVIKCFCFWKNEVRRLEFWFKKADFANKKRNHGWNLSSVELGNLALLFPCSTTMLRKHLAEEMKYLWLWFSWQQKKAMIMSSFFCSCLTFFLELFLFLLFWKTCFTLPLRLSSLQRT